MKKSKRRNSSLKSIHRRGRTQKIWKMRGCASKKYRVCVKCHHKCNRNGFCPVCHHKCSYTCRRRSSRKKRGGSPDAEVAYTGMVTSTSIPNPYYGYTGQRGGNESTMVGSPWGAQVSQWPGVAGPHDGNYLAKNTYDVQPEMNPISERATSYVGTGGRRHRRKGRKNTKRNMRGGYGLFSELGTNITNAYRSLNGEPALPSPLPYKDQMYYGRTAQDNLNFLKVG